MDTKKVVTNETSNDVKREKVRVIPIQFFDNFPKHPFNVKMDEEMEILIESIKEFGILTPLVARKKENERYEIITGHRRKFAAKKLGFTELPVILCHFRNGRGTELSELTKILLFHIAVNQQFSEFFITCSHIHS